MSILRRHHAWSFALLTALAGCSTDSIYGTYFKAVLQMVKGTASGSAIARKQAAAIPYATLGYRINGSAERALVLATDNNGVQMWTSAAHIVLQIKDGHVTRSVGLTSNISNFTPETKANSPSLVQARRVAFESTWIADFPELNAYSVLLRCQTATFGPQTIKILDTPITTVRIDERCKSDELRWSFTNSYWLDSESGFVWRTRQHMSPRGDVLDIEILRPPG